MLQTRKHFVSVFWLAALSGEKMPESRKHQKIKLGAVLDHPQDHTRVLLDCGHFSHFVLQLWLAGSGVYLIRINPLHAQCQVLEKVGSQSTGDCQDSGYL